MGGDLKKFNSVLQLILWKKFDFITRRSLKHNFLKEQEQKLNN